MARASVDAEVVDLAAARAARESLRDDEPVLTLTERLARLDAEEPARIFFEIDLHDVLGAHTLAHRAAERHEGAARELQIAIVVTVARLEPHQRHLVGCPRAEEHGLTVDDTVLRLAALEHDLALRLEERDVRLHGGDRGGELDVLIAADVEDAVAALNGAHRPDRRRGRRPGRARGGATGSRGG